MTIARIRLLVLALIAISLGFALLTALGQEAPRPSAGVATVAPAGSPPPGQAWAPEQKMTLWFLWKVGGWCMWPLGLTNIAAVAFIIYGYLIVREDKMLVPHLVPQIQEAVDNLRIDEAVNICTSTPSMLTNVLQAGLQRISDGVLDVASMEKAMEDASVEETQAGMKMLSYLSVSAQIAPMLGLLGTVSGMIKAFQKIGRGAMGKPEVLANDIGEALITTAYGLIIGIPAMCFYFYLKNRYTANITRMGRVLGNLTHRLVTVSRRAESGELAPTAEAEAPATGAQ